MGQSLSGCSNYDVVFAVLLLYAIDHILLVHCSYIVRTLYAIDHTFLSDLCQFRSCSKNFLFHLRLSLTTNVETLITSHVNHVMITVSKLYFLVLIG